MSLPYHRRHMPRPFNPPCLISLTTDIKTSDTFRSHCVIKMNSSFPASVLLFAPFSCVSTALLCTPHRLIIRVIKSRTRRPERVARVGDRRGDKGVRRGDLRNKRALENLRVTWEDNINYSGDQIKNKTVGARGTCGGQER